MTLPNPLTGKKSKWKWSEARGAYIYKASGRAVKSSIIRNAFEKVILTSMGRMEALTLQLVNRTISLAAWQLGMSTQIKILHMATAAAGRGGWSRMSPSDWKYANSLMKTQLVYLNNFAKEVRTGKQALDGRAVARSKMYAEAGRSSFEQMQRRFEMVNNGKTEEMLVLGIADHCGGCLEDAGKWVPIGSLRPIGSRTCLTKCHCTFVYR